MSEALIQELIEAGTPAALVAKVACALAKAEAEQAVLAKRRENERLRKAKSRDVTGQDNCHVTSAEPADKPEQKEKSPTPSKEKLSGSTNLRDARESPAEFDVWWSHYPHKIGRADAVKSFVRARRKASFFEIEEGLRRYIRDKPPDRQWCNPATWLNQERWNDQPATVAPSPRGQHEAPRRNLIDAGRDRVAFLRQQELLAEQGGGGGDVVVQFLPESRLR